MINIWRITYTISKIVDTIEVRQYFILKEENNFIIGNIKKVYLVYKVYQQWLACDLDL